MAVPGSTEGQRLARKDYLYELLEEVGRKLEPTDTQRALAERRYHEVGLWLSAATDSLIHAADIYPHGSFAIGTTVKPVGRDEFDLDAVYFAKHLREQPQPAVLKRSIGDRLKANPKYAGIVEEKRRCWRLNWGGQFHMDITPSIANARCSQGGELVPDKELRAWKPTNPRGYRDLIERRARLVPTRRALKKGGIVVMDAQTKVQPFPVKQHRKGVLKRGVQLLKRHRDIYYLTRDHRLRPISILITTLASQSYELCINRFPFESDLDLLIATVQLMPLFIEKNVVDGRMNWFVWNETTRGENFAEKWNAEPELERAFRQWHAQALADVEALVPIFGNDVLAEALGQAFGARPVREMMDDRAAALLEGRETKRLKVAPVVGLTTAAAVISTPVRAHTFYGRPEV